MKKLALLLAFAASLTFAQQAARPASHAPAPAKSACVPLLQAQMDEEHAATSQWKESQYKAGLKQGLALGAGAMLLIIGVAGEIRKLKQTSSASQKAMSRAASA